MGALCVLGKSACGIGNGQNEVVATVTTLVVFTLRVNRLTLGETAIQDGIGSWSSRIWATARAHSTLTRGGGPFLRTGSPSLKALLVRQEVRERDGESALDGAKAGRRKVLAALDASQTKLAMRSNR
jgi:hypothetical protein